MSNATYILGRTERERRRLLLQGSILNPLTRRFLRTAGLAPGMRVLDLGCGIGDVTLIAAEITGTTGEVIGIDTDAEALNVARQRARDANCQNVRFEQADLAHYAPPQAMDAVTARHILIHTPDPIAVLLKAKALLHPGGIAAFQEYDLSFWPAGHPEVRSTRDLQLAMVDLFHRLTPHPNIGMRLHHLMQQAGFRNPQASAECLIDGGPDSPFYEWFAETANSLGLSSAPALADHLRDQTLSAQACFTTPLIVSTHAQA